MFIDEDGDGINDLMRDDDGDGIPNCQDPDWTCPGDCQKMEQKHQHRYTHQHEEKMTTRNCPHSSGTPEQQEVHRGDSETRHDNTHRHGHDQNDRHNNHNDNHNNHGGNHNG